MLEYSTKERDAAITALRETVRRSAETLDTTHPGWHNLIEVEELNMRYDGLCIASAINADSVDSAKQLDPDSVSMGFYLPEAGVFKVDRDQRWEDLTQMWRDQVQIRLTKKE